MSDGVALVLITSLWWGLPMWLRLLAEFGDWLERRPSIAAWLKRHEGAPHAG